jgi:ferrous iron transport protein B
VTPSSAPSPTPSAPAHAAPAMDDRAGPVRIALLGNPNTGKTTLFNRLSGLRHKTSNFPGTTLEARLGRIDLPGADGGPPRAAELIDLPGIYSLELDQLESAMCRDVLAGTAAPACTSTPRASARSWAVAWCSPAPAPGKGSRN